MKKTKKKILMILANPFTNDSRVYNEASSLTKAGHEVTVLAWDNKGKKLEDGFRYASNTNSEYLNINQIKNMISPIEKTLIGKSKYV